MQKTNQISKTERYNDPFPTRLRLLMETRTVPTTRQELAEYLGVSPQQVSNYMLGVSLPDYKCLYKLAKFFNVSTDYLLDLSKSASSDIDERKIHDMLGLSEETIKMLVEQMTYLQKITMEKQAASAIDKFNSTRREAQNSPYLHFSDYIDHYKPKNFNIDYSDKDVCMDADLFVPYSYIFNEFAMDEHNCDVLGELYDLMIFIESDLTVFPTEYDYDDLLAIRLVRVQRAFMSWLNHKLGRQ